ncbi:hypothetical protein GCM10025331_51110 [Actinoplanes utahensis]|nr:hypothetical protein Aut01nite_65390 [Actinoplanes utahensis]
MQRAQRESGEHEGGASGTTFQFMHPTVDDERVLLLLRDVGARGAGPYGEVTDGSELFRRPATRTDISEEPIEADEYSAWCRDSSGSRTQPVEVHHAIVRRAFPGE